MKTAARSRGVSIDVTPIPASGEGEGEREREREKTTPAFIASDKLATPGGEHHLDVLSTLSPERLLSSVYLNTRCSFQPSRGDSYFFFFFIYEDSKKDTLLTNPSFPFFSPGIV